MNDLIKELAAKFKKEPEKNFLVIYVVAGHGMNVSGQQSLLVNEYNSRTKFYKMFSLEQKLRWMAEQCVNSYSMAFCACCR